jgi:hypothetical protein
MDMSFDYAITQEDDGTLLAHTKNCPYARNRAAIGFPVMTLFDCGGPLPNDIPRHACLEHAEAEK